MSVPSDLRRYSRASGVLIAVATLAAGYPSYALVQLAVASRSPLSTVQTLMGAGLLLAFVFAVHRAAVPGAQLTSRRVLVLASSAAATAMVVVALATSPAAILASLATSAFLLQAVTPLRGVGSTRWPRHGVASQERTQRWTYGTGVLLQTAFAVAAGTAGLRIAVLALAVVVVFGGAWMAAWSQLPCRGSVPRAAAGRRPATLGLRAAVVAMLALGVSAGLVQFLFAILQPHLVALGLEPGAAGMVAAVANDARLLSIPALRWFGTIAERRRGYAGSLAGAGVALSGVAALGTLVPAPTAVAVVVSLVAATLLQVAMNCQSAATRSYLAALSLTTAAWGLAVVAAAYAAAAFLASAMDWPSAMVLWMVAGLVVWVVAAISRHRPSLMLPWHDRTPCGTTDHRVALVLDAETTTRGGQRLTLRLGEHGPSRELAEGDRIVVDRLLDPAEPRSPRITTAVLTIRWPHRPRTLARRAGSLRLGSRFPLVDRDGRVLGHGRWRHGEPGRWALMTAGGRPAVVLTSPAFGHPSAWRHGQHHL